MPTNITKKRIVPSSEEKRGENRAWKEPEPEQNHNIANWMMETMSWRSKMR